MVSMKQKVDKTVSVEMNSRVSKKNKKILLSNSWEALRDEWGTDDD